MGSIFSLSHTNESRYREAVNAMQQGDESAKTKVAFYKLSGLGHSECDAEEAVELLEERTEKGDSEAMWMLGMCHEFGIGTKQDIPRANLLYDQSCGTGNVIGKFFQENDSGGRGTGVMKVRWGGLLIYIYIYI